jgi:hypothetical protein
MSHATLAETTDSLGPRAMRTMQFLPHSFVNKISIYEIPVLGSLAILHRCASNHPAENNKRSGHDVITFESVTENCSKNKYSCISLWVWIDFKRSVALTVFCLTSMIRSTTKVNHGIFQGEMRIVIPINH